MLLDRSPRAPLQGPAVVPVTPIPVDLTPTDDELRDAVHRLIARATCATGLLPVGSREWCNAPVTVQLASVAVIGQEYVPEPPLKQASAAISAALDWRAEADVPSFAELQRRRQQPGPLAGLVFDPAAARRWVETGSEEAAAA